MAFDFPANPVVDQEFVDTATGATYRWNSFAWARQKAAGSAAATDYVLKAGDTMTGPLNLPLAAPVAATEATNKNWVETRTIDAGAYVTTGTLSVSSEGALEYKRNDLPRWSVDFGDRDDDADFRIQRFNDGGGRMAPAFVISRKTGTVDFPAVPTHAGARLALKKDIDALSIRIAKLELGGKIEVKK